MLSFWMYPNTAKLSVQKCSVRLGRQSLFRKKTLVLTAVTAADSSSLGIVIAFFGVMRLLLITSEVETVPS